jgi:hypothetical protein
MDSHYLRGIEYLVNLDREYQREEERQRREEERLARQAKEDEEARLARDEELSSLLVFDGETKVSVGVGEKISKPRKYVQPHGELDNPVDAAKGRHERQVDMIVKLAYELGYNPLKVPRGGKRKLMHECIKRDGTLFTKDGFNHAWKKTDRLRVENSNLYKAK